MKVESEPTHRKVNQVGGRYPITLADGTVVEIGPDRAFEGVRFEHWDLSQFSLTGCTFTDCSFVNCDLSVVDFSHSKFSNVAFVDSILDDCAFLWTEMYHGYIHRCSFAESRFVDGKMTSVTFIGCTFITANFNKQHFTSCVFDGCEFGGAAMDRTIFSDTMICKGSTSSSLEICASGFFGGEIKGSKFRFLKMSDSIFLSMMIDRVDLWQAKVTNTKFEECKILHAGFNLADLSEVTFEASHLEASRFRLVDFASVSFESSSVANCSFEGSYVPREIRDSSEFTGNHHGDDLWMGTGMPVWRVVGRP